MLQRLLYWWIIAFVILLFVLATGGANAAQQGDTWTDFSFRSYHYDRSARHNEANYGIGLTHYVRDRIGIQAGGYDNSNWHRSYYAGLKFNLAQADSGWNMGLMIGFVNGYSVKDRGLFNPYLLLTGGYEGKTFGFDVGATSEVIAAAFKIKW